jgi:hypothetical protein
MPKKDYDAPPSGWQPSADDLRRLRNAPRLDPDRHLGGRAEEESGLAWLAKQGLQQASPQEMLVAASDAVDRGQFVMATALLQHLRGVSHGISVHFKSKRRAARFVHALLQLIKTSADGE